jgi:hypothetical protein
MEMTRDAQEGADRRRYERWDPGEFTTAFVTSFRNRWCGRILNLSDGGTEVLGLPPENDPPAGYLSVEIFMDDFTVNRLGHLASVRRSARRNSHVIEFLDGEDDPEIEYACTSCGRVLELSVGEGLVFGGCFMCAQCEDLAALRLGFESHRGVLWA